jgi:hypothetical protein
VGSTVWGKSRRCGCRLLGASLAAASSGVDAVTCTAPGNGTRGRSGTGLSAAAPNVPVANDMEATSTPDHVLKKRRMEVAVDLISGPPRSWKHKGALTASRHVLRGYEPAAMPAISEDCGPTSRTRDSVLDDAPFVDRLLPANSSLRPPSYAGDPAVNSQVLGATSRPGRRLRRGEFPRIRATTLFTLADACRICPKPFWREREIR